MADEVTETKVTEFEDGSKIVETVTTESEYIQSEESRALEAEIMDEIAEVEAVEEVTDATVQIAEIEANRDIIIAEIQAETQVAAIEAVEEESADKWSMLEMQVSNLSEQVATLTAMLSIPPASEALPSSQTPPSESAAPEVTPESLAEERPPEPPKRAKKLRWI